jgi:uncharacterized peroxidase-related enzyme
MFLQAPSDTDAVLRVYQSDRDQLGFVMNLSRAWAWRPDVFDGFAALRNSLTTRSSLSPRELAVIVCAAASSLGDAYCSLAWGKKLAQAADAATAAAVLQARDCDALSAREKALAVWVRKVATDPNGTRAEDVGALRTAGFGEQEIFEATTFAAFRLAFSTVNDALGVRPDRQIAESAPQEVRDAVPFGRQPATANA